MSTGDNVTITTTLNSGFNKLNAFINNPAQNLSVQVVNPDNIFTINNAYDLLINKTGEYIICFSMMSTANNQQLILLINNIIAGYGSQADNNSCSSVNLCSTLQTGMTLSLGLPTVNGITNLTGFILFVDQSKKIVQNIIANGQNLEQLNDTNIVSKSDGQVLMYRSLDNKWYNQTVNISPYPILKRRHIQYTSDGLTTASYNSVNCMPIFSQIPGTVVIDNNDVTTFQVIDNYSCRMLKSGLYSMYFATNLNGYLPGNSVGLYIYSRQGNSGPFSFKCFGQMNSTDSNGGKLYILNNILSFNINEEWVLACNFSANHVFNNFTVTYLPQSSLTINQAISYVNPPTQQISYISINKVATGIQQVFNVSQIMCIQSGVYDVLQNGNLSIVYAPNATSQAYIQCNKNMLVNFTMSLSQSFSTGGVAQGNYIIQLFDLTSSVDKCSVDYAYTQNINDGV